MEIEHKAACGIQFKANDDGHEGVISGYASTWDRDLGRDRFEKGAFKDVVQRDQPEGRIKIFREHKTAIGLPAKLREDDVGLWVEAKVEPGDTVDGDETIKLSARGVYDSFSVAFKVDPSSVRRIVEGGVSTRVIGRVAELPHIGILPDPMNLAAVITSVKNHGQQPLIDYEKKGLFSLAEILMHLAIAADIESWSELSDEEVAVATDVIARLAEASEAIKSRLPRTKIAHKEQRQIEEILTKAQALKTLAQRRN